MEWPARFIYVCSATDASIVNVLPIVHAGLDRIEEIVVFCGAPSARVNDARLRREALEPAERIEAFVALSPSGPAGPPAITRCYGDAGRFGPWASHMSDLAGRAGEEKTIVFNMTGGTKPMAIGGVMGMGAGSPARIPIYVSGTPPRSQFIDGSSQYEAPQHYELTLPQYLAAYGIRELDPRSRAEKEAYYETYHAPLLAFGNAMIPRAKALIPILRELLKGLWTEKPRRFKGGVINATPRPHGVRGELAAALESLTDIPGFSKNPVGPGLLVEDESVADLLDSGWLEGYLYLRLMEMFPGRRDVSVNANVRLGYANDPDAEKWRERGEIDVALLIRGHLHMIEAKTSAFGSSDAGERNDKALSQTESVKRQLVGNLGCCFVVNPRDTLSELRRAPGNFVSRAESAGIELLLGPDAISALERRVRELVPPL